MFRLATDRRGLVLAAAAVLLASACSLPLAQPEQLDPNEMTAPVSAADTRAEFERVKGETPLPHSAGWKPVVIEEGWYGEWGGGSMVEFQALCAWLREAADATKLDDAERIAAADAVLAEIPSWRTFSDPARMDPTSRTFVVDLIAHARKHDFAPVGSYLAANCS
jgi:hypothetical protein